MKSFFYTIALALAVCATSLSTSGADPVAPVADANGPYSFCPQAQPWLLDGTGSVNPDEGQSEPQSPGDTIAEYAWDLDGDGQYDDASGVQPDVSAYFTGQGSGDYPVGLRVTDTTGTSFPSSGLGDLSDIGAAQVSVKAPKDPACGCVEDLVAVGAVLKVDVSWTPLLGADHHNVYRAQTSGGPYVLLAAVNDGGYVDTDVIVGVTYYYVVRAAAANGDEICQSNEDDATPLDRPDCIRIYTLNADFDEGVLVGVEHDTIADQLQLSEASVTLPFIWVPNQQGTVSKLDTATGKELGRYWVCNPAKKGDPSRTTVDLHGNCYVANRTTATLVKIGLLEAGQYIDRNGNGVADTSIDLDNDGNITGGELLPWGHDECVLFEVLLYPQGSEKTVVPGSLAVGEYASNHWNPGPRSVAVDAYNNCWVGTHDNKMFYYVEGNTGTILRDENMAQWDHTAYGAVIDGNGVLWSSGQDKNHVLYIQPTGDPATQPLNIGTLPLGHFSYGLSVDSLGNLFASGWTGKKVSKADISLPPSLTKTITDPLTHEGRGVAVTPADNDVWVVSTANSLVQRYDDDLIWKATIRGFNRPTGIAVDAAGKVWVCDLFGENIHRIDPASNAIDLTKAVVGSGGHYSYSDMTGLIVRNVTTKIGTWTVVHNSGLPDMEWGIVSWTSVEPSGSEVRVAVRSRNDGQPWSVWEPAVNGALLTGTPDGQHLEVKTTLQLFTGGVSPVLMDLTVQCLTCRPEVTCAPTKDASNRWKYYRRLEATSACDADLKIYIEDTAGTGSTPWKAGPFSSGDIVRIAPVHPSWPSVPVERSGGYGVAGFLWLVGPAAKVYAVDSEGMTSVPIMCPIGAPAPITTTSVGDGSAVGVAMGMAPPPRLRVRFVGDPAQQLIRLPSFTEGRLVLEASADLQVWTMVFAAAGPQGVLDYEVPDWEENGWKFYRLRFPDE